MQRRTALQVLSAAFSVLFVGVGKASAPIARAVLPARLVKKVWGPYVDILPRPILQADGSLIVARMVNPASTGCRLHPNTIVANAGPRIDPMHPDHYVQTLAREPAPLPKSRTV